MNKLNNVWQFKAGSFGILLVYDAFGFRCQLIYTIILLIQYGLVADINNSQLNKNSLSGHMQL